ncbi:MAG: methyltransferase [Nitrospinae bacterium CG11_big_fil_rev_8_21_14_0_20_45_15]|nr:MAG: methyltransferase [Nitrospinae bacterium CG11_big_fil_rev_8_21_14_0_20_45_15]
MSNFPIPALEGTYHLIGSRPAYSRRFDAVLTFHPPGLAPVSVKNNAWHIRTDGSDAYARRFMKTFGFYDGMAAVVSADGWHHIDLSGKDVYPHRYGWCGNFQGGLCSVRDRQENYFHITEAGTPAYSHQWRYAGDFRNGIGVVQANDGRSTHIKTDGSLLHGRWFLDLDVFHKGFARARDEDGWTHVTLAGEPAYVRRFSAVEPFYNGQSRVECFDGGLEIIGENGATITELRSPLCSDFTELSRDMVGFWRTQTIATAVALGVFEQLPAPASAMADQCGLDPQPTVRLLHALGELGLVMQEEDTWHATTKGSYLVLGAELTLADAALEYAGPLSDLWNALPQVLRAESSWQAADIFAEVAGDEQRLIPHHRMLRSYARHDYVLVPSALALGGGEHVIDAGGGLGTLGQTLLKTYPGLSVTVLERPQVVAQAALMASPGLAWKAGDLFLPWEIAGDVVVLARVLHNWADPEAGQILQHARASLPKGGQLFLVEMLLPEAGFSGALCDLHLLVSTGGQERPESAYRKLLEENGFALTEVRRIPALPAILVGIAQ